MKNIQFKLILFLLIGGLVGIGYLVYLSREQASSIRILRLPHTMSVEHPVHEAIEYMAKLLKERSKGKMIIQIYPGALLGDGVRIKELMQLGVVDIGKFSASDFEDNIPEFSAFCVPYLFTDSEHYWSVLNSPLGDSILNAGYHDVAQIKGLCYYDAGARSFYGKKPIGTLNELKGKKIRVMVSALMVAGVEALGAVPTSMPWGELFTGLQTGTVDGAENNIPSFFTSKHYEICKYFAFTEHFRTPDILVMSQAIWDALTQEEQKLLLDAAKESAEFQYKLWKKQSLAYIKEMEKAGVQFIEVDQEAMRQCVKPFYERLRADKRNDTLIKTIDAIKAMEVKK